MDDILDIEELTKDDSFFSLDKDHDVCNIIQQWKNKQQQQQQKQAQQQQFQAQQQIQTQNNDNAYRVNSRTFTRPKRKSEAQNLNSPFNGISEQQQYPISLDNKINTPVLNVQIGGQIRTPLSARSMLDETSPPSYVDTLSECIQMNGIPEQQQKSQSLKYPLILDTTKTNMPMLNVQIGGQIRTPLSARSMLDDTSPPSYCDASPDSSPMVNSLVTSADFANIDFFLSTPTIDASAYNFNSGDGPQRYTLNDMISDRKALESLTLSGDDGTLIKDSQIAQFDDISLALCKASSGSSTMGNSTESVECNISSGCGSGNKTITLTDRDSESNSTFDINDRTIKALSATFELNKTHNVVSTSSEAVDTTYPTISSTACDETVCLTTTSTSTSTAIATVDCEQHLPSTIPKTPEYVRKQIKCISTPHNNARHNGRNSFLPNVNMINEDVNISPIVGVANNVLLDMTFAPTTVATANSDTYDGSPLSHLNDDEMEMLENLEMPSNNDISSRYRRRSRTRLLNMDYELEQQQQQKEHDLEQARLNKSTIEMQDVMDLVEAEAELLAAADDDDLEDDVNFEHMLDELGRIELNAEQIKMKKSVETIKRRFNCTLNGGVSSERDSTTTFSASSKTFTSETREEALRHLRDEMSRNRLNDINTNGLQNLKEPGSSDSFSTTTASNHSSMAASGSSSGGGGGERLLSRRSRLYDDLNLSTLASTQETAESAATMTMNKTIAPVVQNTMVAAAGNDKTEGGGGGGGGEGDSKSLEAAKYKLSEKRERDRDRFKTIKIVKNTNNEGDGDDGNVNGASQNELNVPCIDNEEDEKVDERNELPNSLTQQQQRFSRRDLGNPETKLISAASSAAVVPRFVAASSKLQSNTNFLTYKKPKEQQTANNAENLLNRPEVFAFDVEEQHRQQMAVEALKLNSKVRSLSRPRYISGLQKCSVVSKAVSAGDLEKTEQNTTAAAAPSLSTTTGGEGKASQLTSRLYANAKKVLNNNGQMGSGGRTANNQTTIMATQANKSELKSPMGLKAKSLHNLSTNMNYTASTTTGIAAPSSRLGSYGLRKINSGGINASTDKQDHQQQQLMQLQKTNSNLARTQKTTGSSLQSQNSHIAFEKTQRIVGLKPTASGALGAETAGGITRPSSGYYNLNAATKTVAQASNSDDTKTNQNSQNVFKKPQRPLSAFKPSTSGGLGTGTVVAGLARPSSGYLSLNTNTKTVVESSNLDDIKSSRSITSLKNEKNGGSTVASDEANHLTRITVGASGIPKPSGLRAPIKRSGLPVPSSRGVVKR